MRRIGFGLIFLLLLGFLALPLIGCQGARIEGDYTNVGAAAHVGPKDGWGQAGVNGSLGKATVQFPSLFPVAEGAGTSAADDAGNSCPNGKCPAAGR